MLTAQECIQATAKWSFTANEMTFAFVFGIVVGIAVLKLVSSYYKHK